jgi:FkbH-like protein
MGLASSRVTLQQALALIQERKGRGEKRVHFLVCGFQPLHVATFLTAFLDQAHPESHFELETGLYGDFAGNLRAAAASKATGAFVVAEWSDFDPRLGLRAAGGWSNAAQADIVRHTGAQCGEYLNLLRSLGARMPVALAAPSLPLPPIGSTIRAQSSVFELELRAALAEFLLEAAKLPGVRVLEAERLDAVSPRDARLDPKLEFLAGFPYTLPHAVALAKALAGVLHQAPPKKGLITDLDDTLWQGIVGEIGPEAVAWHQESHAQAHGLYQQMLGRLADSGVLIAAASKNEQAVVERALARKDLLIDPSVIFPVIANWGAKSASVAAILRTWNIAADSVVFVDDNPMELSEVAERFPGITTLAFPRDPAAQWALLATLRDLFGKPVLLEEDRLRSASIRASAELRDLGEQASSPEFLAGLRATITLDCRKNAADKRPLELINKTNQFNLNGQRIAEGEWNKYLEDPDTWIATVSYEDKFGPLGKIAVLVANKSGGRATVRHWVMSCRAFSRKIEHHVLDLVFRQLDVAAIDFAFQPTERNQPLQEFFAAAGIDGSPLSRERFYARCGDLPHQVTTIPPERPSR